MALNIAYYELVWEQELCLLITFFGNKMKFFLSLVPPVRLEDPTLLEIAELLDAEGTDHKYTVMLVRWESSVCPMWSVVQCVCSRRCLFAMLWALCVCSALCIVYHLMCWCSDSVVSALTSGVCVCVVGMVSLWIWQTLFRCTTKTVASQWGMGPFLLLLHSLSTCTHTFAWRGSMCVFTAWWLNFSCSPPVQVSESHQKIGVAANKVSLCSLHYHSLIPIPCSARCWTHSHTMFCTSAMFIFQNSDRV